jgi:hypothetical protein
MAVISFFVTTNRVADLEAEAEAEASFARVIVFIISFLTLSRNDDPMTTKSLSLRPCDGWAADTRLGSPVLCGLWSTSPPSLTSFACPPGTPTSVMGYTGFEVEGYGVGQQRFCGAGATGTGLTVYGPRL